MHDCPLSPMTAVRIAWARTLVFSTRGVNDEKTYETTELLLKTDWDALLAPKDDLDTKTTKEVTETSDDKPTAPPPAQTGPPTAKPVKSSKETTEIKQVLDPNSGRLTKDERLYLRDTLAAIDGTVRMLETVRKGRDLNFSQLEKLMDIELDYVKSAEGGGTNLEGILKSFIQAVPAILLGGTTGLSIALLSNLPLVQTGALIILGTLGVYGLGIGWSWVVAQWRLSSYVQRDYRRNLYYRDWFDRVRVELDGLYESVDNLHQKSFGDFCKGGSVKEALEPFNRSLSVRPGQCKYTRRHMEMKLITAEIWPYCEATRDGGFQRCPYWAMEKGRYDLVWPGRFWWYWAHAVLFPLGHAIKPEERWLATVGKKRANTGRR